MSVLDVMSALLITPFSPLLRQKVLSEYGLTRLAVKQHLASTYYSEILDADLKTTLSTSVKQWIEKWKCPLLLPGAVCTFINLFDPHNNTSVTLSVYRQQNKMFKCIK